MRGARIALGVVALIGWIALRASRPSRSYYTPPSIPTIPNFPSLPSSLPALDSGKADGKNFVPALAAGEDEGLRVSAQVEDADGTRRIRLTLGAGEVVMSMSKPKRGGSFAFGRGEILPGARDKGAAFVSAFARWLHVPVPAAKKGELEPFAFTFAQLGSDGGWEANKLFFERDGREAEVFFNLADDGTQARFLEKDEDYRKDLVSLLALAVRDGVAPRHTPADDPDFVSGQPLVQKLEPLAQASGAKRPTFAADGAILATRGPVVLVWSDPAQAPRVLARFDGSTPSALQPSPMTGAGGLVAITVVHPRSDEYISSDDPADLQVRDLRDGAIKLRIGEEPGFQLSSISSAVWAPDGSALALSGHDEKKQTITRVYGTDGEMRASWTIQGGPVEWNKDGLWLSHWDFSTKKGTQKWTRWQPGAAAPQPAHKPEPPRDYRFAAHDPEIRKTLATLEGPHRIGPARVLVPDSEPLVLDVTTHKLQYLLPRGASRFEGASADGKLLLVSGADEQLRFARLQ